MKNCLILLFALLSAHTVCAQQDKMTTYTHEAISVDVLDGYNRTDLSRYDKRLMLINQFPKGYWCRVFFKKNDKYLNSEIPNTINITVYYYADSATRQTEVANKFKDFFDQVPPKTVQWNNTTLTKGALIWSPKHGDIANPIYAFMLKDHLILVEFVNRTEERALQERNIDKILSSIKLLTPLPEAHKKQQLGK